MTYNPNAPTLHGPQWPVTREGVQRVDSDFAAAAAYFTSASAETIDSIAFWLTSAVGAESSQWEVEIYNAASLDSGVAGYTDFPPTVDASVAPNIYNDADTIPPFTGTMYTHIDEGITTPNAADWVSSGLGSYFPASYAMRFGGVAGAFGTKIITKVSLQAWAQAATGGTGTPTLTLRPFVQIDGVRYTGPSVAMDSNNPLHFLNHEWPVNPITGVSWKIPEVEKFAADADSYVGWAFDPTGSVNFVQRILTASLRVDWGTTERRVACGRLGGSFGLGTPAGATSAAAILATPAGVDNWAKANATNYLILIRRRSGGGAITVRWLDSAAACPHVSHSSARVGFLSDGRVDVLQTPDPTVLANRLTPAYALYMSTTAPAASPDVQPYASINGDGGPGEAFLGAPWTDCYGVVGHQQEFTAGANATYQSVQVLLRGKSNVLPPDGNLSIRVRGPRPGTAQIGGTITITPAMLVPPYNEWRIFRANISPGAALTNGSQYYLETDAGNATQARSWQIQVLSGIGATSNDAYGFGGTTDRLSWFTSSDIQYADAVISIAQAVTNVTGFAAAAQNHSLTSLGGWGCSITVMQKVHLTWTAVAAGTFARYEIDRFDPITAMWNNIAQITTRTTVALDDFEAPVNALASYRIRTVDNLGAASDWSTSATATPVWGDQPDGLLFCSNENSGLACGYAFEGPGRGYHFLNAETIDVHPYHGRNYQTAFRDLEERGLSFSVSLFVNHEAVPARPGEPVFGPIRTIASASLSYVAVKNAEGEVWYASVAVNDGTRIEPHRQYSADVTVLQTTATPSIVAA